jgi:dephospho-CoA kinase
MALVGKVALTGGIACGKSAVADRLRASGIAVIDADDIVHELIPPEERRRLAQKVFSDPAARRELEARIHPLVKARIARFFEEARGDLAVAVVPLLFEARWDGEYDIICSVVSSAENQISRMMTVRGYSRTEAENRMAAQMPVSEKASKSQYVIRNDGTVEDLMRETDAFVEWLKAERIPH